MKPDPKKFEIPSKATYKLDQILRVAAELGNPERGRKTILVAGTNGKGSTCAFLTALLLAAGKQVGTYSSPHVVDREERIRLQGQPIEAEALRRVEQSLEASLSPLTFFERWTILAFSVFRERQVDYQVIEVGMGGRLDATNICNPDLSLIAAIDYDHQEVLGSTLSAIAYEKAGIMRANRPCLALPQRPAALSTLKRVSGHLNAELEILAFKKTPLEPHFKKMRFEMGAHQEVNARLAFSAYEKLRSFDPSLRKLSVTEVRRALSTRSLWPARMQFVKRKPIFLVEGGHNHQAVEVLVRNLRRMCKRKSFSIIFGMMNDKPAPQIIRMLRPFARRVILPTFYPERERAPADLKELWSQVGIKSAELSESVEAALEAVWPGAKRLSEDVLVVGSFYLAGDVLRALRARGVKFWDGRQ